MGRRLHNLWNRGGRVIPVDCRGLSSFGILAYMQGYSEEEDHATSTRSPRSITGAKRVASHLSLESRVTKLWPFR